MQENNNCYSNKLIEMIIIIIHYCVKMLSVKCMLILCVFMCVRLFPVLPAKPVKSKLAPSAMTDTSSLLNDAEWYWGEISR